MALTPKPSFHHPTPEEDVEIQRGIDADPDNPEWMEEDFAGAVKFVDLFKWAYESPEE